MAWLDFSDIVLSPEIADTFTVARRAEAVSSHGRSVQHVSLFGGIVGVVTMASPNDLERLPEAQMQGRVISVVTKFALFGMSKDYQPDLIVWRGDNFVVVTLEPYLQFGSGFTQAICASVDYQDLPIPKPGHRLDIDLVLDSSRI